MGNRAVFVERTEGVVHALKRLVRGSVRSDVEILDRYSNHFSIYSVRPMDVVSPQDLEDVVAMVCFLHNMGIPLTPRGGESSTAGSALGRGILLAFDKVGPMNRILEFDEVEGEARVTVETGLLHDRLHSFLRKRGLYLLSAPSAVESRCCRATSPPKPVGRMRSSTAPQTATSVMCNSLPSTERL
jgi:FAD/FMN-containing dehydrogenase